jgi:hypothetical protein
VTCLLVLSNDLAADLFHHAASPPLVISDSPIESQEPILSLGSQEIHHVAV